MKKTAGVLLLLSIFSFATLAQTTNTRPRRVETQPAPQQKLPPFLGGGINGDNKSPAARPTPLPRNPAENAGSSSPQSAPRSTSSQLPQTPPKIITSPTPQKPPTVSATSSNGEVIEDDDEVIRVETSIVTIPVSVFDRNGRFVPGLRQTDFKIFEDGKEQQVAYFAATEQPFTVVLLIDVSNSTKFKIDEIQNAAISFVRQLKSNDRVMVVSFDEQVHVLSEPTNNRYQLVDAIRSAQFGGGTSLYDAVDYVLNERLNRIEGRKAVVLFTDGVDTTSRMGNYGQTLRDAEETEALFYPIYYNTYSNMQAPSGNTGGSQRYPRYPSRRVGIGDILGVILGGGITIGAGGGGTTSGAGTSRAEYERGENYLEDLAGKSGGRFYRADTAQNLESSFNSIAEELRRQYSIGYYPSETGQTGQRKQIKVRVERPGTIVRARDSYVVGENASPNSATAPRKFGK